MIDALRGVEICVTQMAPLTEKILDACPDLRLFCISRGGPVNANIEAATRHGVAVTSAPGRNATATAEHTVAMMLAGFGAEVVVFDPYVTPEALGTSAEQVELDELLSRSRIVTLHARVTPETTGMIGAAQLAAMPAGSVI